MPVYNVPPGFSAFDGLREVNAVGKYTGKISLLSLQPARGVPGSKPMWNGTDCVRNAKTASRRRDCHFTDTPCLSLLKHILQVQGVPSNDSLADG